MKNQYRLYVEVAPFYQDLVETIGQANHDISMMYFTYDCGKWSRQINAVLYRKVEQGVKVRIMVDLLGFFSDHPKNIHRNITQISEMKRNGIQVNFFQPGNGSKMTPIDRLHFKICAVDKNVIYIGGSNIGDHYTNWQDTNLRVEGDIGMVGHDLYDYVFSHSRGGHPAPDIDLDNLWIGDAQACLTVPGQREDIADSWLDLIRSSKSTVYFRNWYFLPNNIFMAAILEKLNQGQDIEVLLSHRTRVPVIDIANHTQSQVLVNNGARIFRYHSRYMHSKVTWTREGDILFGSANLEDKALKGNFEFCLRFTDLEISRELISHFRQDSFNSLYQSREVVSHRNVFKKASSYIFSLATPLL